MPRKPQNNLDALAKAWDAIAAVRDTLREEQLTLKFSGPTFHATVKSCSTNWEVLAPVLERTKTILVFNGCGKTS